MLKKVKTVYELQLLARTLLSKKTPLWGKVFAGLAVAYTLSPIDVIPDVLPVIGWMDDVAFLTTAGFTLAKITKGLRAGWREAEKESR